MIKKNFTSFSLHGNSIQLVFNTKNKHITAVLQYYPNSKNYTLYLDHLFVRYHPKPLEKMVATKIEAQQYLLKLINDVEEINGRFYFKKNT